MENDAHDAAKHDAAFLSVAEVAEALGGVSLGFVYTLIGRGEIPHVRLGTGRRGRILVPREWITRLAEQTASAAAAP